MEKTDEQWKSYTIKNGLLSGWGNLCVLLHSYFFCGGHFLAYWFTLVINIALIVLQIMNSCRAFVVNQKNIGVMLIVCLLWILLQIRFIYFFNWSFTVRAFTVQYG